MDNAKPFIKYAMATLGANGSKFVDYDEFLRLYKRDTSGNFEQQAQQAGYSNGLVALHHHRDLFEIDGLFVRRKEISRIQHIVKVIDASNRHRQAYRRHYNNEAFRRAMMPISK